MVFKSFVFLPFISNNHFVFLGSKIFIQIFLKMGLLGFEPRSPPFSLFVETRRWDTKTKLYYSPKKEMGLPGLEPGPDGFS